MLFKVKQIVALFIKNFKFKNWKLAFKFIRPFKIISIIGL
jgi:hypothetical protein